MKKKLFLAAAIAAFTAVTATSAAQADPVTETIVGSELPKCVNGVGVPGGCFGPNGEIIKAVKNAVNDVVHGPGEHNDLVGRKGWLRQRLGF
jgi:hypothetical protein